MSKSCIVCFPALSDSGPGFRSVEAKLKMLCNGRCEILACIRRMTAAFTAYLVLSFHEPFLYPGTLLLVVADTFCIHELGEGSDDLLVEFSELLGLICVRVVDAVAWCCADSRADGDWVGGYRKGRRVPHGRRG